MSASLPPLGAGGFARWAWRQFTSMRTALLLLLLLALASIPGSLLPQRGQDDLGVDQWLAERGALGSVLDAMGMFDVFASAWFAAVYLLLFVSLLGCVIPRLTALWRAWRAVPPAAPRALQRLAATQVVPVDDDAEAVRDRAAEHLRRGRWRVRVGEDATGVWVAAEKGYLKEAGNLGFHVALALVLVAVGVGGLLGWRGSVIVPAGQGFSNTVTQFDSWSGGRLVSATELPPFSFTLDAFEVDFEREDAQRGAPRRFDASVTYRTAPGGLPQQATISVNEPLRVGEATVFLVGHGYAPRFTVTDGAGSVVFDDAAVFLPQDGNFTSTGVIKAPDASPSLGVQGVFLPTLALDAEGGAVSSFPAPDDPAVVLAAWTGDLGLDSGVPQSVYTLQTDGLDRLGVQGLRPGQSWQLPDGAGTITFTGYERWASFQVAHDPGKGWALAAALLAMLGMTISVVVQRRRLWVKAIPGPESGTVLVQVSGLTRTAALDEAPTGALADDIRDLITLLTSTAKERA